MGSEANAKTHILTIITRWIANNNSSIDINNMQWNIKYVAIGLGGTLLLIGFLINAVTHFEQNVRSEQSRLHSTESAERNSTSTSRPERPRSTAKDSRSFLEIDLASEWTKIADSTLNSKEKFKQFRELIDQECRSGRHAEVLEQLISSTGPGSDRNTLIATLFANDHIPLNSVEYLLDRLDFEQEKSVAARALSSRLSRQSLVSIPPSLFQSNSPALRKSLVGGIEKFARSSAAVRLYKERLEQTLNIMQLITPDQREKVFSEAIAISASANDPFEAWSFLQENSSSVGELVNSDALERIMRSMIQRDPATALQGVLDKQDLALTDFAFQYYIRKDPNAATIWFQSNSQNLSKIEGSLFRKAAAIRELTFGNIEYAAEHAALIENDEIREKVVKEIEKHE